MNFKTLMKNYFKMNSIITSLKKIPLWIWIFCLILTLGIFLRTYNFNAWMTFNPDQARDALLVQDMISKKQLPELGPQAGNTRFKLGPIFYYFEYASAKIFGKSAQKMAYPDLFFSILSIPLLFLLARKFFQRNVSLILMGLYSISFFAITYSRFAFNPNSIPFFSMLFLLGLFEVAKTDGKDRYLWAGIAGAAMGVGTQLHALLFVSMPIVAVFVFVFTWLMRKFAWKSILAFVFLFLFFNAGLLSYEINSGWLNTKAFFSGASSDAKSFNSKFLLNVADDLLCQSEGNLYVISSLGGGDKCSIIKLASRIEKKGIKFNAVRIFEAVFAVIFSLGGYILFIRYFFKEKDKDKKRNMAIIALYVAILLAMFIPFARGISIRYYISMIFLPFIFLGFWIKFAGEYMKGKILLSALFIAITFFALCNMVSIKDAVSLFRAQKASTNNVGYYGEIEQMSLYIFDVKNVGQKVYLAGSKKYLSRFFKPLEYFAKQQNINLVKITNQKNLKSGDSLYYISKKYNKKTLPTLVEGRVSLEVKHFGNVSITKVANE